MIKLKIFTPLDDYTSYHFDDENKFFLNMKGIRESDNPDENILKYTKKDLEKYYSSDRNFNKLLIIKKNKAIRYIIINEKLNIIFIPITNKFKNIINYTCSDLFHLEKIKLHGFFRNKINEKEYIRSGTTNEYMHEIIFGKKADKGNVIDHVYSNTMDNRSKFLREITIRDGVFTGIKWRKDRNKWSSSIVYQNKQYNLGCFKDKIEAVRVRDMYSVYFYRGIQAINRLNGKKLLTDEEIENILQNGIPEKYQIKDKEKEYPLNIKKMNNSYYFYLTVTEYFKTEEEGNDYLNNLKENFDIPNLNKAEISFKNEKYYSNIYFTKKYKTLEEALNNLEKLKSYFENYKLNQKKDLERNIDKYRNKNGIAVIKAYNKSKDIFVDIEVDDEDWLNFIHYNWYLCSYGYPRNTKLNSLHIAIFKNKYKEIYEAKKDDETIDHIDQNKLNAKKSNLRLVNKSIQNQNKKYIKEVSFIDYRGVIISNGNFYAQYTDKYNKLKFGPYEYLEDAAEKYNQIIIEKDPFGNLNIISNNKTSCKDLFHKDNINIEKIQNIKTILEIKEIFRNNLDWKKKANVSVRNIRSVDLEKYKRKILDLMNMNI